MILKYTVFPMLSKVWLWVFSFKCGNLFGPHLGTAFTLLCVSHFEVLGCYLNCVVEKLILFEKEVNKAVTLKVGRDSS